MTLINHSSFYDRDCFFRIYEYLREFKIIRKNTAAYEKRVPNGSTILLHRPVNAIGGTGVLWEDKTLLFWHSHQLQASLICLDLGFIMNGCPFEHTFVHNKCLHSNNRFLKSRNQIWLRSSFSSGSRLQL